MKINTLKFAVLAALAAPITAIHAEEAPAAASAWDDWSVSANVGLYSDYIWRGVTQTNNEAALQGGFDVEHSSGFYAGVWASNVEWTTDGGYMDDNSLEIDAYAGYAFDISDISFDIGVLQYMYPGDSTAGATEVDATEVYAGLGYDFGYFSAGYYAYVLVSDEGWGFANADGTVYHDISAEVPVGETGLSINGHYGIWVGEGEITGASEYDDWKVGLDYALNDNWNVGVFHTDVDTSIAKEETVVYLHASF